MRAWDDHQLVDHFRRQVWRGKHAIVRTCIERECMQVFMHNFTHLSYVCSGRTSSFPKHFFLRKCTTLSTWQAKHPDSQNSPQACGQVAHSKLLCLGLGRGNLVTQRGAAGWGLDSGNLQMARFQLSG
jgi:hypothetical protein